MHFFEWWELVKNAGDYEHCIYSATKRGEVIKEAEKQKGLVYVDHYVRKEGIIYLITDDTIEFMKAG